MSKNKLKSKATKSLKALLEKTKKPLTPACLRKLPGLSHLSEGAAKAALQTLDKWAEILLLRLNRLPVNRTED